jgi:hypothetical protein
MVLAVNRRAVPVEARIRSQASPGEILGVSYQYHSKNTQCWFLSTSYIYHNDKRANLGALKKSSALSEIGEFWIEKYSGITSTNSPSFCTTTFSAILPNVAILLPQLHDCSYYVSGRVMELAPLWSQEHAVLRAHCFDLCVTSAYDH